ncbi:uridine kinase family protein [Prosthecochloris sp. SCSIO W1103]|uniref:uridine kinase family protein n=1 Tax=Prosthecochloris sp. SCSIO W1103 TaxID=2992244 RepID=UPI00223CE9D4|nr:uridine kinase [Prosthecochloris sp. SCSIO W1103]UZJ36588.1 uridine kinase [Prosthecochloris sp. SCSIO W1103]
MLNDILLIGEKHKKAAESIAERVLVEKEAKEEEQPGHRFIVAISGESGAGKSELSHSLATVLKKEGIRVKILHTDNYYLIEPLKRRAFRELNNFEDIGPQEYDREQLQRNIADFRKGHTAADMPCIDIITEKVDRLVTDFSDIDLLIIDGLYAIATEGIDLGVYIDLTYKETKKNQMLRGKELTDDHRWKVLEKEHQSATELRRLANTFVSREYKVLFRD